MLKPHCQNPSLQASRFNVDRDESNVKMSPAVRKWRGFRSPRVVSSTNWCSVSSKRLPWVTILRRGWVNIRCRSTLWRPQHLAARIFLKHQTKQLLGNLEAAPAQNICCFSLYIAPPPWVGPVFNIVFNHFVKLGHCKILVFNFHRIPSKLQKALLPMRQKSSWNPLY